MWVDKGKTMLPSTNTPSKRKQKQSQLIRPGIGWSKSCAMGDSPRPFSIDREICYLVITSPRKEDELLIKKRENMLPFRKSSTPPHPRPLPPHLKPRGHTSTRYTRKPDFRAEIFHQVKFCTKPDSVTVVLLYILVKYYFAHWSSPKTRPPTYDDAWN